MERSYDGRDLELFSFTEDELIADVKRPSLVSLTSDESHASEFERSVGMISRILPVASSTPQQYSDLDDYDFKAPECFPVSRGKRYSLTAFNDIPRDADYSINKSNSMHDVSAFTPLRRDSCLYSTETLHSNSIATKSSKDSGFQRSTSCTSLTTNASKKYDHVQSKVRQYIMNIKQTEALHRMKKQMDEEPPRTDESSPSSEGIPVSKKDLLSKVKELQDEIKERDCMIEQLEKNHTALRLKYAAAENKIDHLRAMPSDEEIVRDVTDDKIARLLFDNARAERITRPVPCAVKEPLVRYAPPAHVSPRYDLPYEKNSFAKVQQWQRSLVNLCERVDDHMEVSSYDDCSVGPTHRSSPKVTFVEHPFKKPRLYVKHKDAEKSKSYRKSFPSAACKCADAADVGRRVAKKKLHRSASFANYDDSMTSSVYDSGSDSESSVGSSVVFVPRRETYKLFKQRRQCRERSPKWSEIAKTKSAGNLSHYAAPKNKRMLDTSSASHEYSCDETVTSRAATDKSKKYRKLDDASKVMRVAPIVKCVSAHACSAGREPRGLAHSASYETYGVRDNRRRSDKSAECSCLLALERLKIQEMDGIDRFAEHIRFPKKSKDKSSSYKRYSSHK